MVPVVLHTGPSPFVLASPRHLLDTLPSTLKECLPELPIVAIDLASTVMERLLGSIHLDAAITYIHYKAPERADLTQELRNDMALAHPIHPESAFARELREERYKGLEQGVEQGLELEKLEVIGGMLENGLGWAIIQKITHLDQAGYEALKAKHQR